MMGSRVLNFDGSQESVMVFRNSAGAGVWADITLDDALEEKLRSRLMGTFQCTAPACSTAYWRQCPRAGIVPLALALFVQTLIQLLQPQTIAVTAIARRIASSRASGTSNALAPGNQVYARYGSF
jgi:hypothetical protein